MATTTEHDDGPTTEHDDRAGRERSRKAGRPRPQRASGKASRPEDEQEQSINDEAHDRDEDEGAEHEGEEHEATEAAAAGKPGTRHPAVAARTVAQHDRMRISLPIAGQVGLPPREDLAFFAGVGALAVVGALEWPVAAAIGVGHALATMRNHKIIQEFGEAIERA